MHQFDVRYSFFVPPVDATSGGLCEGFCPFAGWAWLFGRYVTAGSFNADLSVI